MKIAMETAAEINERFCRGRPTSSTRCANRPEADLVEPQAALALREPHDEDRYRYGSGRPTGTAADSPLLRISGLSPALLNHAVAQGGGW